MKNKLVIWGTNAENEKVMVALELQPETSKVMLHIFPEAVVDEEFNQKMMHDWREGNLDVAFPEGVETLERELSVTESLLPEHIKVERPDLVQRAQTEWHFAVLSAKLYDAYQQELAEFKEKVASMSNYDNNIFTGLRSFWDKVQNQSRERNLYRQHADDLRDGINALFDHLKEVRKRANSEFMDVSQKVYDGFAKALDEIDERITTGGGRFNSVFDELKKIQREYHTTHLSNEHRNKLWDRLDAAFKRAKERKFGPEANAGTIADRHDKRLSSLEDAIRRLEDSLRRDDEELTFQRKKVHTSEGQLEAQIRGAKIKMIEERANGKRDRLAELSNARNDVHRQASSAHEKEARMAAKEAERKRIEAKKAAIKSEIEAETHAKATAAAGNAPYVEKEESVLEAASNLLGDILLDALDTAKAVASVAAEKASDVFEQVVEKAEKAYESYKKEDDVVAESDVDAGNQVDTTEMTTVSAEDSKIASTEMTTDQPASTETDDHTGNIFDNDASANETDTAALESYQENYATTPTQTYEGADYIIDDVVHKTAESGEELESFTQEDASTDTVKNDGIIIDDVVHKSAEEEGLASGSEETSDETPERDIKKEADA